MKRIVAILFFAATLAAASAQTNVTRALSLQDCFQSALQHNFDVQIERFDPQISLYNLRGAYAGYDPAFNLSGEHNYNKSGAEGFLTNGVAFLPDTSENNTFKSDLGGTTPWGMTYDFGGQIEEDYGKSYTATPTNFLGLASDSSGGEVGVTLTQPLLRNFWIDENRLVITAAKNKLKQSEQQLRLQLITTVTSVENAYYELIFARENLKVQQQALDLAQTQLNQDKQRVDVGSLAPLDVQQDEAQAAQSHANLIAAEFTLEQDQNALKNLITDRYTEWHETDIAPSAPLEAVQQFFDVQDSWSKGMTQRPELIQARIDVEQQGIQLKFDRNQIFPELDLNGSYGFNGAGREYNDAFGQIDRGNRPFYSFGASLSVPLSNAKARNSYKSDKATEQELLLKLKQLEQNIMVDIDNAVKSAQSSFESVEATKQARGYAEAALDAEQKKYNVGKSTTFTVLQLQNNLTSARSQEIRALVNYNQALANLAQAEGNTLVRRQIDVSVK